MKVRARIHTFSYNDTALTHLYCSVGKKRTVLEMQPPVPPATAERQRMWAAKIDPLGSLDSSSDDDSSSQ